MLLNGNIILSGSVDKTPAQSTFPNVPTDDVSYSVSSSGPTNGSSFRSGRSSFQEFCIDIPGGTHTIEFAVADQGNHAVDSGLIIDNVYMLEIGCRELKIKVLTPDFMRGGHVDFGEIPVGTKRGTALFRLENAGCEVVPIRIQLRELTAPQSALANYTLDLNAGDRPCGSAMLKLGPGVYCTFGLTFNPQSVGKKDAYIEVFGNELFEMAKMYVTGVGTSQQPPSPPSQQPPSPPSQQPPSPPSQQPQGGSGGGCSIGQSASPLSLLYWILLPILVLLRRLQRG